MPVQASRPECSVPRNHDEETGAKPRKRAQRNASTQRYPISAGSPHNDRLASTTPIAVAASTSLG